MIIYRRKNITTIKLVLAFLAGGIALEIVKDRFLPALPDGIATILFVCCCFLHWVYKDGEEELK